MTKIKSSYKLKPLYVLDGNWTKVCNTMIFYIPDAYTFKIYVYLCYRYNNEFQYAFPSLNTIANDTNISKRKVQESIKWLESQEIIIKQNYKDGNKYFINYVDADIDNKDKRRVPIAEELFGEDIHDFIEVEDFVDEDDICNKTDDKFRKNYSYRKWRENVLSRDDYTCKLCGKTHKDTILNVHHIVRYSDSKKLRTDVNNGITLCYECHKKIFNKEKEFEEYFRKLIN